MFVSLHLNLKASLRSCEGLGSKSLQILILFIHLLCFAHLPLFIPSSPNQGYPWRGNEVTKQLRGVCGQEGKKGNHAPWPWWGVRVLMGWLSHSLGLFCLKIKWNKTAHRDTSFFPLLLPPYPYGVLLLRPRNEWVKVLRSEVLVLKK